MKEKVKISVAIACHNRRETTLACLSKLADATPSGFEVKTFLFDDASSDGTSAEVAQLFPAVVVLRGDGNHFWGGGMNAAMTAAMAEPYDFLLMLNDDVSLFPNALFAVYGDIIALANSNGTFKHILVGAVIDPSSGHITYAGFRRLSAWRPHKLEMIPPNFKSPTRCDTMNGNFVLIPKEVAAELGPVDAELVHRLGDIDLGYRASELGTRIWVATMPVGECPSNRSNANQDIYNGSILDRWRKINSPLVLHFGSWFVFMRRHAGLIGLLELLAIYAKKLFFGR